MLYSKYCQQDFDGYEKISELGNGAYGKVYLVKKDGELFALKTVPKGIFNDISEQQLQKEIYIHKKLVHTNIIKLHSYYQDRQHIHLLMEYAEGGCLYQRNLTLDEIQDYFSQICNGIYYLHSNNIIHRDLKPENILLKNNVIKLCDFGWSAEVGYNKQRDTLCGTIDYMAPEVSQGKYSFKVDTWSLGIILYEMIHHSVPKIPRIYNCPDLVKDLIDKLLVAQDERLSISQVLQHPFVKKGQVGRESILSVHSLNYNKYQAEGLILFNELDVSLEQQDRAINRMTDIFKPRQSRKVPEQQIIQQTTKKTLFNTILDTLGCMNRIKKQQQS
ncbi:unnamed protein product [Paramecium sonneborni]|uniref:Protein kinase domain-containing protein n=1 Tax=Paramecium sonneborni TaxID=65129 RepID=A0A8S1MFA0_9CILI|nr:unnamed protein product [Paramecium sonneborni]